MRFYDTETNQAMYKNKKTGKVTPIKPADFDERGGEDMHQDTDTTAVLIVEPDKGYWEAIADKVRE